MELKKFKIKDLEESKRPMEKLKKYGVDSLSNVELLAILIGSGTKDKNALEISEQILDDEFCGKLLLYATIEELMRVKGIHIAKASRILSGLELGRRLGKIDRYEQISYNNPDSVAEYFYNHYQDSSTEEFVILILDSKNKLIALDSVSKGTINSTLVHPREVFKNAIKKSANSIILVHNHPSGDPTPSDEDISITKRLKSCGEIIGINVLDHIIVGANRHISLRERNII